MQIVRSRIRRELNQRKQQQQLQDLDQVVQWNLLDCSSIASCLHSTLTDLPPTAAVMNIITLVILTLSLLLVNADDDQQLLNHYTTNPSAVLINNCCDLRKYPVLSGVHKMKMGTFDTANVYCDMTTDDGGWIVVQRNRKNSQLSFNKNWREFEDGFGDLKNDFWAGLKLMNTYFNTVWPMGDESGLSKG